jgi:uncharacterized delta-60 repeat protein/gliding motility-associated-like protein
MKRVVLTILLTVAGGILFAQPWHLINAQRTGGTADEAGRSIVVDASGNVLTTGFFSGTVDFDPGPATFNLTSAGATDIFVTQIDASGNFVWARRIGGTADDIGLSIAVDPSGNVYIAGAFQSTVDFNPGSGTFNLTSVGGQEIFLCKLNALGNFVFAKRMGGNGDDFGRSVAMDAAGNIFIGGSFANTGDFDPGAGSFPLTSNGLTDIVIIKLDQSGNFLWAKQMGGTASEFCGEIAIDGLDNVLTVGTFGGPVDFDPGPSSFVIPSFGGTYDIYISKLDNSGNFVWAKQMGGNSGDFGNSIAIDASNNVYTTGSFFRGSPNPVDMDPGPGVFPLTPFPAAGPFFNDVFVSKLNSNGDFVWAQQLGGSGNDLGSSITLGAGGNVFTTGYFDDVGDYDPGSGTATLTPAGGFDAFVTVLNSSGNYLWTEQMGGTLNDQGEAIATDPSGNVYTTGFFQGTANFGPGCSYDLISAGGSDIFLQTLSLTPPPVPTFSNLAPSAGLIGSTVTITGTNFSTTPTNNLVTFNGIPAVITASTSTTLTMNVPYGATTGPVGVSIGCNNIAAGTWTLSGSCLPVQERDALIALYNSTNGASWVNSGGWLSTDESTWEGVAIGSGCHVTELIFITNNLTGTLPTAIGDLPYLTNIDMESNHISGVIPPQIGNLTNLSILNLFNNQFSGSMPLEIGNLSGLTKLELGFNKLTGTIPSEIGALQNLLELEVGHNQLSGTVPPEIWDMTQLTRLSLFQNQLFGDLSSVGHLYNLRYLKIGSNKFYGPMPPEIANLSQLVSLWLDDNQFDGVIPAEIGDLTLLTELYLDNNQFSGAIPPEIGNLPGLNVLSLHHNRFVDLPDLSASQLNSLFADIAVYNNYLTFEDLEPNTGFNLITYSPQAKIPPGGVVSFVVGGTLTIPFTTPGTANSYQWFKDGIPIPGATSATLVKPGMTASDAGSYSVHIKNSIATGLTLESFPYTIVTDPCSSGIRTAGDLDTGFDPLITSPSFYTGVATQSTGKILAATSFTEINTVAYDGVLRFNTDGTLDNTFTANSYGPHVVVQPDNEIISSYNVGTYAYVVRMDADGNDDATFNSNTPQYYSGNIHALALQSNGKIAVLANSYMTPTFVARLNPDGTPDGTFSNPLIPGASAITVQPDGYILVGGSFAGGITRFDPTGAIDPAFSTLGADNTVTDIALQSDGKIIVTGYFENFDDQPHRGIARLNTDGSTDASFKAVGITDDDIVNLYPYKMAIQNDDKIILAGSFSTINGANRENLARVNADGTMDCAFDPELSSDDLIENIALQSDGKIIITGGFTAYEGVTRNGLARVNNVLSAGSCLPPGERAGLIALYNSTNGGGWTNKTNWLSADESTWFGVTIISCHVTSIDLKNNKLVGSIPVEIGNFPKLDLLDLSENKLSGTIPVEVGNLVNLKILDIFTNQLTGGLPKELALCLQLKNLEVAENMLSGPLPVELKNLANLEVFEINDNAFTGPLPVDYLSWTKITDLYLSNNKLDALPAFAASTIVNLTVENNILEFGDLESNIGTVGYTYSPQADLPGGTISVNAGTTLTIPFTTSGTANNYQWYKNNVLIAGATSAAFSIASTVVGDAGSYTVFITSTIVTGLTLKSLPYVVTVVPVVNISPQPSDVTVCDGIPATFTTAATGAANITYQWQFSPNSPLAFADIVNGTNYSGVTTSSLTVNATVSFGAGRYRCRVNGDLATEVITTDKGLFINPLPVAPLTTGNSGCSSSNVTVSGSGGINGTYRWYTTVTGGTAISGEVNDTYVVPSLTVTTTVYLAINNGTCESSRTPVTGVVIALPSAPTVTPGISCAPSATVVIAAAGGISGQYRWYTTSTGGSAIAGETNSSYTTPILSVSTTYFVSINDGTCESLRTPVLAEIKSCTPVIATTSLQAQVGGQTSIDIAPLVSTVNSPVDINSIKIVQQPISGAVATMTIGVLRVDYTDVSFTGTDRLTIEACDMATHCGQQEIVIEVAGDIIIYNAVSPNGDDMNPIFFIKYIDLIPATRNNKVTIYNRWGDIVFETQDYDNVNRVFRGFNSNGNDLPSGTYFYKLDFEGDRKSETGYLSLRR